MTAAVQNKSIGNEKVCASWRVSQQPEDKDA